MAFVWFVLGMLTMVGILFFGFYTFALGSKYGNKEEPNKKDPGNGLHLVKNDTANDVKEDK